MLIPVRCCPSSRLHPPKQKKMTVPALLLKVVGRQSGRLLGMRTPYLCSWRTTTRCTGGYDLVEVTTFYQVPLALKDY